MNSIPNPILRCRLLLAVLLASTLQINAQLDTAYIQSYYHQIVPRLIMNYKNQFSNFYSGEKENYSADYFSTGSQSFIGVDVNYKGMSIGYNFAFNKENSTANTDFRLSQQLKGFNLQLNLVRLNNLNYYRIQGEDQQDTLFLLKQKNISLRQAGLKVDYLFNHRKCYYSPSTSPYGRQVQSQGSWILSTGLSYQDIDLRGLSDSAGMKFMEHYPLNSLKTLKADLGLGYVYNWVPRKNLVLSISEIPNIGFQQINSARDGVRVDHHPTVSFSNYVRADVLYTINRFMIGAYAYNTLSISSWSGYTSSNVYTSFQLYLGLILDKPTSLHRKFRRS